MDRVWKFKNESGIVLHNAALICKFVFISRGRAVVARRAHNPKVAGSSPALATKTIKRLYYYSVTVFLLNKTSEKIEYTSRYLISTPFSCLKNSI